MRKIHVQEITPIVKELCMEANYFLGKDVLESFRKGKKEDDSPVAREVFGKLLKNAEIARQEKVGMCQDTGLAVVFVDLGEEVCLEGGNLIEAINQGVREGYQEGYLRKSTCDPFTRANKGDNTPAIVHLDIVPGDKIKLIVAPKGGGSENMSEVKMMKPADGKKGIINFVVDKVKRSGANPCPPVVVGVGIGGTFERCAFLAKKALLREIGNRNTDPELAEMEKEMKRLVNNLGIGPQGLGGRNTALDVFIELEPCHIASLPVAVNLNCHAARHKERII